MTTYRLFAKNASGDTLFFTPDADGADYLANLTAKQAFEVMTTRKTGHRWSDDRGRFSRNRIATFRLVHDSGHAETFTLEQAAAAIATTPVAEQPAPVVTVEPVTETTQESLALLNGISAEQDRRAAMTEDGRNCAQCGRTILFGDCAMLHVSAAVARASAKRAGVELAHRMIDAATGSVHGVRIALQILQDSAPESAVLAAALAELDARHPAQYVTATDPNGVTWYLTNRYGHGVEAGKYFAGAPREFAIAQRPTVSGWTASGPLGVQVRWTQQGTEGFSPAANLAHGWHWRADTEPQPVAMKVPGSITLHRGDERTTVCGLTGVPTGQGGPRCAACFA